MACPVFWCSVINAIARILRCGQHMRQIIMGICVIFYTFTHISSLFARVLAAAMDPRYSPVTDVWNLIMIYASSNILICSLRAILFSQPTPM